MKKIINQEEGKTTVTLYEKGKVYKGTAKVHPDDEDFGNARTGEIIAECRARQVRHAKLAIQRENEIKELLKQIEVLKESRDYHKLESLNRKEFVEAYISKKDMVYKQIRKNRENPEGLIDIVKGIETALGKLADEQE